MSKMWLTGMTMATDTRARVSFRGRHRSILTAVAVLCSGALGAAHGASWRVVPDIGVSETYSDNVAMVSDAAAEDGWITTVSPGLRVSGLGPRIQAFLDVRHDESYYHSQTSSNVGRSFLTSYATVEAIDNWLYVDASAAVAPRSRSIFSAVTTNTSNVIGNQDETRVVQVSPNIRGRMFGNTDYLMRYTRIDARSKEDSLGHTQIDQATGSLRKPAGQGAIGWFADAMGTGVDRSTTGDERRDDRVRGGLIVPVIPHLHVLAFAGRERTDFVSGVYESFSAPGVGFEWRPTEHTEAIGMREKRFFGNGHDVSVTHRTPRTAWRYSDVKDAAALPMGLAGFTRGSVYDLMSDLLTVSIADPVARDEAARARTDQIGGATTAVVDATGVLASRIFLDRTRQASLALLGTRSIVTLILQRRDQQLLENSATFLQDDFELSPDIRDSSGFLSWIHRLTPVLDLSLSASYVKREGLSVPDLEATQRSGIAALNFSLSPKARGSLAVRFTNFSNLRDDSVIHERAFVGTLTQGF